MASSADEGTIRRIRDLATRPEAVASSRQVQSDLMAHHLTVEDICDAIGDWIDASERVKPTVIRNISARQGQPAYEMKPRINGWLYYIKVVIDGDAGAERMTLLSAHPDH
ncbi:MAG: hypothetical protein D6773_10590 [Alphaproteobacteria bacterium]|nr:MAG: hypothetical protein D6773_10590 [Alphaproteobacteria bacterium]